MKNAALAKAALEEPSDEGRAMLEHGGDAVLVDTSLDTRKWRTLIRYAGGPTRLELATSGVTGQCSNQIELRPQS